MLTANELAELGWGSEPVLAAAVAAAAALAEQGHPDKRCRGELLQVRRRPARYADHAVFGPLARLLLERPASADGLRAECVPRAVWGRELLDEATLAQFETACRLPVAARAAQMADGHVGYGLPIGGVLATRGTVIPYAVGVDIACRMRLSVFAEPVELLQTRRDDLKRALVTETRFGVGAEFSGGERREHAVMDEPTWSEQPLLAALKDRAWAQLGSSGSGNHFAEWGELETDGVEDLGLAGGRYLALLSHSGSRYLGGQVAEHFTKLAQARSALPPAARQLAWLDLDHDDGRAYWEAMSLAGRYAAANHELLHTHVARAAGLATRAVVENHHNFAWLETHDGEELVVHRKGATPAGAGVLGIIPGSMGEAGYVVRGLGQPAALCSASHGAGRRLSRKQANATLTLAERTRWLAEAGVELLAGGLDESPQAYKRLPEVMRAQRDLVEPLAAFTPRVVLMAAGGPAED